MAKTLWDDLQERYSQGFTLWSLTNEESQRMVLRSRGVISDNTAFVANLVYGDQRADAGKQGAKWCSFCDYCGRKLMVTKISTCYQLNGYPKSATKWVLESAA
ncbi:hypothetical protein CRG98_013170 [Punica granatum]|uniref:Uncharacterized protein n=1 Tax=Punica granatum TaxID=22663 RepID=A0A2I0KCV4_PUNGR|nr:hypothetical protein CRG98_013170 [Punica granatum]